MCRQVSPNSIYKFDNTIVVGRISNNNKTEYRKEIECLAAWCKDNNLSINVSKMKELVIGFRKRSGGHAPLCINGPEVEMVKSIKFLGVMITSDLSSCTHDDVTIQKAQHLLFLRRQGKFAVSTRTENNFYALQKSSHLDASQHGMIAAVPKTARALMKSHQVS
eukprot:g46721.t1